MPAAIFLLAGRALVVRPRPESRGVGATATVGRDGDLAAVVDAPL